ncbi:IclR family transcriptional regulator [Virgisporangium aliadipatigenens]|uniref:IclR family transcriptional regulator n=1 Tax=Virgisporangium aliadipatigenens TaxID=741659 RepID=UPI00194472E3|nr:helix-turn-helix domain-containing protein [Virgisporangium aliadipatigenens]
MAADPAGRGVVDGAFRLLRALPETVPGRQIAQLVRLTDLPRPTVHRLLRQLREAGAVDLVGEHWTLGADLVRLARRVEPHAGLRACAQDVLRVIRAETGLSATLVVPEPASPVVLEMVPGALTLPVAVRPGDAMPAFTASGRVLAAARPASPKDRHAGVAVDHGAVWADFTCYAVAVLLPGDRRAALQISSVDRRPAERFAPLLHRAGFALQQRLAASAQRTPAGPEAP